MTDQEIDTIGGYAANYAELVNYYNASFIVPASNYQVKDDNRLLIPFMQGNKIGFVNRMAEVIVKPQYDLIVGEILSEKDMIVVGLKYSVGFPRNNGAVEIYNRIKYGLLDSNGNVVLDTTYNDILISDNKEILTLRYQDLGGYCVVDRYGKEIVPYNKFNWISGFTNGYAKVKSGNKWGIIDIHGNVVLPIEYDNIWNFYNKPELDSTIVIKNGREERFYFDTGCLTPRVQMSRRHFGHRDYEDYGSNYGEFAGTYAQDVAGYSDDVINDAFEGDPDAYWNID